MQELQHGFNKQIKNLVTNSTLMKLVNNVAIKERLVSKTQGKLYWIQYWIATQSEEDQNKVDDIKEFEQDLIKVVEDKDKKK